VRIYSQALSAADIAQLAQVQADTTPPSAPNNLQAQAQGGQVNLSWQASTDPESGINNYRIYRDTTSGGNKALLTTVSGTTLAYTDSTTAPSSTYYYQVSAVNGANLEGTRSAEATATPNTINPTPALYYRFEEGQGSQVADVSNHGWTGALVGNPTWVAGRVGGGLQLVGSSQYVDAGFTQHLDLWTISAWVKSPNAPNGGPASGPINFDRNFQINWNHPEAPFRGAAGLSVGGTWYPASFGALQADTWYQLTATYDGETLKAYTNGVLVTANTAPSGPAAVETSSLKLGRHANANQFFGGTIDEVQIYSFALSDTQVAALMQNDTTTPPGADLSLGPYYKLDEGSGSQTVDSSNHVAPANLIGNPTWITGIKGNGLSFSGSGQYVDTGFTQNLPQWTISTWVKSPTAPNSNPASGPINFDRNFQINWNHPSASFRGAAGLSVGGTWYSATFGALQADTWYQLTATYDGHTLITYKNGVVTDNNPAPEGPAAAETGTLKLGRHANAAQYFSGAVDEVRVYNRALSAAEVNALVR
jgi:hypothetical protein